MFAQGGQMEMEMEMWPGEAQGQGPNHMMQSPSPTVISLSQGLGIWSAGSAGHEFGYCKPCAFMWKEEGCKSGVECPFCHLCSPGEIKRRKKDKVQFRKISRVFKSHMVRFGSGVF